VGKDGKKRGTNGSAAAGDAERSALLTGEPRWNVAGRRVRKGPEGNDLYRTGSKISTRDSSDDEQSDEDGETDAPARDAPPAHARTSENGASSPGDSVWRTSRQQSVATRDGGSSNGHSRRSGLPQSMSSDMADAAMMQEMLALNLRDEGESILEDGDLEGALAVFTQAMSYAPNFRLYVARAQVLLRLGRSREAHSDAQQLVTLLPSFHTGHALLGQALEQQGRLAQAGASYEKASFLASADGDDAHADEYDDAALRCKKEDGVRETAGYGGF
jgi:tetratricopeptide (TPR) repeat protein